MQSLDIQNVDTADNSLNFLFDRDIVENLFVTNQRHNLGTNLCLDNGQLGAAHHLGSLVDYHLRKSRILYPHPFFINNEHRYGLLVCLQHFLLFSLSFLGFFS